MEILRTIVSEPEKLAIFCLFAVPVMGLTFFESLKLYFRHRERIELIQQGIHPDFVDQDIQELAAASKKRATSA